MSSTKSPSIFVRANTKKKLVRAELSLKLKSVAMAMCNGTFTAPRVAAYLCERLLR